MTTAVVAVAAAAGVVAALWLLRKSRFSLRDDIDYLIGECDRAADRMERTFTGRAQAS